MVVFSSIFIMFLIATTNSGVGVFLGMPFLAAGASAMPMLLGYLTEQVFPINLKHVWPSNSFLGR